MANPKSVYYTFRKVVDEPLVVEARKWDDMVSEEEPIETYRVLPNGNALSRCSCPAYRECKHFRCVHELIATGRLDNAWEWMWHEKNGWTKLDDIKPIEEL